MADHSESEGEDDDYPDEYEGEEDEDYDDDYDEDASDEEEDGTKGRSRSSRRKRDPSSSGRSMRSICLATCWCVLVGAGVAGTVALLRDPEASAAALRHGGGGAAHGGAGAHEGNGYLRQPAS